MSSVGIQLPHIVGNYLTPDKSIAGGGPTKFTNKKITHDKVKVDLTSAPPINHHLGNGAKEPKSKSHNHPIRNNGRQKANSLPSTRGAKGVSTRPINSAPHTQKTTNGSDGKQATRRHFPKINAFTEENVRGLSTAQLALRGMTNGKHWASSIADQQEAHRFLRASGSNDKLVLRKQKPEKSHLEETQSEGASEKQKHSRTKTDHEQTDKQDTNRIKHVYKLDMSKVSSKIDTGQSVKKPGTPRSSSSCSEQKQWKRVKTTLATRRLAWKKFRRKTKNPARIFSQKNAQTEKQLQSVYNNNTYRTQRQTRVLNKVEEVQYKKVQDFNRESTQREFLRTNSILAQRKHLKLLRDRFDAEQVKRFKNQYVSWKGVENDRLDKGSEAYGLPDNIYLDRYSKEIQPVTAKTYPKKTFKAMASRVRNIQKFRLILDPKSTYEPEKVLKVSNKLLIEGIDTVQLPETDNKKKHKKPTKVRAVIGSAKRVIMEKHDIDAISELSEGEWDDLSSLDLSDSEAN
ncbi:uncharacterized protein LOC117121337 isoform X2 [Anneissia japonica]|uniref:uncharacterized protein LOC117121337 isoform X2 n=1 Tax=Anneissia japonica TaxID=1529436 RepID=UPI0014255FEE|nr:uncharacterized protein LOC117121337 isoform X2 [Anneissia japonica]